MKQRNKFINRLIVIYLAGIFLSWTGEFWRDIFKNPIAAWTALDAFPSGRDFVWPITMPKRIFSSKPAGGDYFAEAESRYRAALLVADRDRAPTGMTLQERDSAAILYRSAADNARNVDVTILRNKHGQLPVRYRYQFIEALDHFAEALRQNDDVLWDVAKSQMSDYDQWYEGAFPAAKP